MNNEAYGNRRRTDDNMRDAIEYLLANWRDQLHKEENERRKQLKQRSK